MSDLVEDEDGLTEIESQVAKFLWEKYRDPENPAVLIHEDPRTVARELRPFLTQKSVSRSQYCGCAWCCASNPSGTVPGSSHNICPAEKSRLAAQSLSQSTEGGPR